MKTRRGVAVGRGIALAGDGAGEVGAMANQFPTAGRSWLFVFFLLFIFILSRRWEKKMKMKKVTKCRAWAAGKKALLHRAIPNNHAPSA